MKYAQVQHHDVENVVAVDGEQTFAAETVVDATGVIAVASEEEEFERRSRCVKLGFVALASAVAASVIALVLKTSSNHFASATVAGSARTPADSDGVRVPTPAPTNDAFPLMIEKLRPVSGDSLKQGGTPAALALDWIVRKDALGRDPSDPRFIQRYIMAVFYYSTGGDDWKVCSAGAKLCGQPKKEKFLSESDECDWFGNDCRGGHIYKIYHGTSIGNNLVGTLPRELAWLPELESLFVQNNQLHGTIPAEYGRLSNLHTLFATNNRLESPFPDSILDSGLMGTISIENNRYSQQFPRKIMNQMNLKMLSVQGNEFMGPIDPNYEQLSMLEMLQLSHNQFTGTVPEGIAAMTNLESFLVDNNKLTGLLPSSIFSMSTLRQLNVTGNALTGTLPSPEIGRFGSTVAGRRRKFLNLANNKFRGTVPPEVADISDLKELTLHGNDFVGTMPSTVCALKTGERDKSFSLTLLTSDCGEVDCSCSAACTCY